MPDVFVSYSRRDGEFVRGLVTDLEARGKTVWVDTEGIADAEVFPEAIRSAIEGSDAFVFVITPESAASAYCEHEVEHALTLNKRVVPVLREPVPDEELPEAVRVRNWIPYTADVEPAAASERLVAALDTDLEHVRAHTRWLVKALEWDAHSRDKSLLLRGSELASFESWLAGAGESADPAPTALQREYALASRTASTRRQRILVGASLTGLVIALVLAGVALVSRNQATHEAAVSKSRALAAHSQIQLAVDPELSVLLGTEAVQSSATAEGMHALRQAIDGSPIRLRLPSVGDQTASSYGCACLAYSPDGRWLAESSAQGYVAILDAKTGALVRRIPTQGGAAVNGWSADGKSLAIATERATLVVDPATGRTRQRVAAMPHNQGAAFSADGSTLYGAGFTPNGWKTVVGQKGLLLPVASSVWVGAYDLASERFRGFTLPPSTSAWAVNQVDSLALSPDGRHLAVGALPGLAVFDIASGRAVKVVAPTLPPGATAATPGPKGEAWLSLAYSPDGTKLAGAATHAAGGDIGGIGGARIAVLDARTLRQQETAATSQERIAYSVAFSPDGSRIAYGFTDGTAGVYSLPLHRLLVNLPGHQIVVSGVAFSPDGMSVASASADGEGRVWRATGNERLLITPGADQSSGEYAALVDDRVVADFTPENGPDAGNVVLLSWSRTSGLPLAAPLVLRRDEGFPATALSGDGRFAAVLRGHDPARVRQIDVWDIASRRVVKTLVVPGDGGAFVDYLPEAWSSDSRYFAVAPALPSHGLMVFDRITGHATKGPKPSCDTGPWKQTLTWSADASLLAASSYCGDLLVWDPATGRVAYRAKGLPYLMRAVSFSPDGARLLVAGLAGTKSLTVIDSHTGRHLLDLVGLTTNFNVANFSPDGTWIATSSDDGIARLWDASTGRVMHTITLVPGPFQVRFGPDNDSFLTVSGWNIQVWDACTACRDPGALVALAKSRVTRELSADDRRLYRG